MEEYIKLLEQLEDAKKEKKEWQSDLHRAECEIEAIMDELSEPEEAKEEAEKGIISVNKTIEELELKIKKYKQLNPERLQNDPKFCKERRAETLSENNVKLDKLLKV